MQLNKLQLFQFKNYLEVDLTFHAGAICFAGRNGAGKTNLLDALHFLSLTKSYFTTNDSACIAHQSNQAMIKGTYLKDHAQHEIICYLKKEQRKVIKHDNVEYEKLSQHIGALPLVMITPIDDELITGGSEIRRRFMDNVISQCQPIYLHHLVMYNKILAQRNALLKLHAKQGLMDYSLYDYYDAELEKHGEVIRKTRRTFFEIFNTLFNTICQYIAPEYENASINYLACGDEYLKIGEILKQNFKKDSDAEYTTAGIHKEDLDFAINNFSVKKFASQGQQKTFVIALKLAQYQYMQLIKNVQPILLLDDIYDKLDDVRAGKLMEMVSAHKFGQIFITDTNLNRIKDIFHNIGEPLQAFTVNNGQVVSG